MQTTTTTRPQPAKPIRRIGLLTGGGDCPGLNAVIRVVTKEAAHHGVSVLGFEDGFLGLIENRTRELTPEHVTNLINTGGTILGSSNKANPAKFVLGTNADGSPKIGDVCDKCIDYYRRHELDALVVVGGDGTMTVAHELAARDTSGLMNFIGVPKTIDNDLWGTDLTFGFLTAVSTATDAIDRVHTTAASHHRVMVVEVMGRNAGWIALHSGVAAGADVVLLPEIPFTFDSICASIDARRKRGKKYSIIVAAEGAKPAGGEKIVSRVDPTSPDPIRLGGVGKVVADKIEDLTGIESRYVVLGHVQRGGSPVAADRVLATQFGHHAMRLLIQGARMRMVVMKGLTLADVDIAEPAGRQRLVTPDDPLVAAARSVNTSFGDDHVR